MYPLVVEKKWYVIHTYAGYENKVKKNLDKRIESMEMQDKIFGVLVPMEKRSKQKTGKNKPSCARCFQAMSWWRWLSTTNPGLLSGIHLV